MSLKSKTKVTLEKGRAQRGNFEPSGVPLRMYRYWESNSHKAPSRYGRRENFCHYWRVVAIWAPLMWLGKSAGRHVESVLLVAGVVILLALTLSSIFVDGFFMGLLMVLLTLAIIVACILGMFAGASLTFPPAVANKDFMPRSIAVPLAFIPTSILGFIIAMIITHVNEKVLGYSILTLVAAVILVVLPLSTGGWSGLLIVWATVLGTVAFVAMLILGGVLLSDMLEGRAVEAKERLDAYIEEHGDLPPVKPREPSRIEKFFSGLGDFIVFIAQVVRVKKWKICPLVDLNK